jgi:hypothetical protein
MIIHSLGVTKNVSFQYNFLFKTVESATPDLNVMEWSCNCPLESLGFVGDPTTQKNVLNKWDERRRRRRRLTKRLLN